MSCIFRRSLCVGLMLLATLATGARSEPSRSAVLIGNSAYRAPASELPNPRNDVRALNGALLELGFTVVLHEDGDLRTMQSSLEEMRARFAGSEVGLFFYAGHAVQYRGSNYLLPTDFKPGAPGALNDSALALDRVLAVMRAAGVKVGIVLLDACRDNPFGAADEAFGRGLALVDAPGEALIVYATSPGAVAEDGVGPNSPFTAALVSALELPGQSMFDVFRLVRAKVRQATHNRQIPWILASVERDLSFRPEEAQLPLPGPAIALDSVSWKTIRESVDPRDFERFVQMHPASSFTSLAKRRLDLLESTGKRPLPEVAVATPAAEGTGPTVAGLVTDCDILAGAPYDEGGVTPGVEWGLVNTRLAIRACVRTLADNAGNPRLTFLLGRALDIAERFDEAEGFYRQAAELGYAQAFKSLGYMQRTGRGRPRDDRRAAELYYQAAVGGAASGRTALAALFERGWGVPQSDRAAFEWYELVAGSGQPAALDALGNMYRDGRGVAQDAAKAFDLYDLSARLGHSNGMHNLARAYLNGIGTARDPARALRWFNAATEQGNPYSPYYLGRMYREGWSVEPDDQAALRYFELSALRGFAEAWFKLAEMHENGEGVPTDLEAAHEHYFIAREAGLAHGMPYSLKMAEQAKAKLDELRGTLGAARAARVEARAQAWLEANGVLQFSEVTMW